MKKNVLKMLGMAIAIILLLGSLTDNTQAQSPSIDIKKYTNGLNANTAPGPEIPVGQDVRWDYVVTNNGDTSLINIIVSDDKGILVTCPSQELIAGDSMICFGTGSATEGPYENTGTVSADFDGNPFTGTYTNYYTGVAPEDSDGDGITDDVDQCQDSDSDTTIIIDGCDTGVGNQFFDTGCKMSDLIFQCATNATNHGKFVSCVAGLTNAWKKARLISGKEKGKIQSCAAKADIP